MVDLSLPVDLYVIFNTLGNFLHCISLNVLMIMQPGNTYICQNIGFLPLICIQGSVGNVDYYINQPSRARSTQF